MAWYNPTTVTADAYAVLQRVWCVLNFSKCNYHLLSDRNGEFDSARRPTPAASAMAHPPPPTARTCVLMMMRGAPAPPPPDGGGAPDAPPLVRAACNALARHAAGDGECVGEGAAVGGEGAARRATEAFSAAAREAAFEALEEGRRRGLCAGWAGLGWTARLAVLRAIAPAAACGVRIGAGGAGGDGEEP